MAARALLAFNGRGWTKATVQERAGALLLAEAIDNIRITATIAQAWARAASRRRRR